MTACIRRIGQSALVLAFLMIGLATPAQDKKEPTRVLHGEVVEVTGDTIRVSLKGRDEPKAGDAVKITYEIPGTDIKADVAKGKVAKVEPGMVTVAISDKSGEIRKGYLVEVISTGSGVPAVAEKLDLTGEWTIAASKDTAFGTDFTSPKTFRLEKTTPGTFMITEGNSRARILLVKNELHFYNNAGNKGATSKEVDVDPKTGAVQRVLWSDGSVFTRNLKDTATGKNPEPGDDKERAAAEKALADAEAVSLEAQKRFERAVKLFRDGALSEKEYYADRAARDAARAKVEEARALLERLNRGRSVADLSGRWEDVSDAGKSVWTLKRRNDGRYDAEQKGFGNARGIAVLSGDTLKIDWKTDGGFEGTYEWTLEAGRTKGSTSNKVIKGSFPGTFKGTVTRLGTPAVEVAIRIQPFPDEIVRAWQVGTLAKDVRVGRMKPKGHNPLEFEFERGGLDGTLPAFWVPVWGKDLLSILPDPGVPFGLNLGKASIKNSDLDGIGKFKSLHTLVVYGSELNDAMMAYLEESRNLRAISLSGTQVTDKGLKSLCGFAKLQALDLHATKVTDAGMESLAEMRSLEWLNLTDTALSDGSVSSLAQLKNLKFLFIQRTKFSKKGFEELSGLLPGCKIFGDFRLNTRYQPIPEAIAREWGKVAGVSQARVTKEGGIGDKDSTSESDDMLPIFSFSSWKEGMLSGLPAPTVPFGLRIYPNLTDGALKDLAGFKTLELLDVSNGKLTDAGLRELAGLTELRWLRITQGGRPETGVNGTGFKNLGALKLHTLDLYGEPVSDVGGLEGLKSLRVLNLSQTKVVRVDELAALTNLQSLNLYLTKVADVNGLGGLTNLQVLNLGHTKVTDEGIAKIDGMKSLRELNLYGTQLTDDGLKAFLLKSFANLKELKRLDLGGTRITSQGFAALRAALPGCQISGDPSEKKDTSPEKKEKLEKK